MRMRKIRKSPAKVIDRKKERRSSVYTAIFFVPDASPSNSAYECGLNIRPVSRMTLEPHILG
jgi:hypothetical protein